MVVSNQPVFQCNLYLFTYSVRLFSRQVLTGTLSSGECINVASYYENIWLNYKYSKRCHVSHTGYNSSKAFYDIKSNIAFQVLWHTLKYWLFPVLKRPFEKIYFTCDEGSIAMKIRFGDVSLRKTRKWKRNMYSNKVKFYYFCQVMHLSEIKAANKWA